MALILAILPATAHAYSSVTSYSSEYGAFLRQVWQFFLQSTPSAPLAKWGPINHWMREKFGILSHEENYAFVMDHFCESVDVELIPNRTDVPFTHNPRWLKTPYGQGCPKGDPSFAENGHVMLANGLGCLAPTRCLQSAWLTSLKEHFTKTSKHVSKRDLFFPADVCNIPYAEKKESGRILPYSSYRFGLYLDFLLDHKVLEEGRKATVMEVGAGWGGFAALVKGKLPATRCVILDIPTSSIFQMGLLHRLGYKRMFSLDFNATREDARSVLCCVDFDVLWIGPHHVELLPDDAIDVAVNFDSMIEMMPASIDLYLRQIARVSRAFYHVNRAKHMQTLMVLNLGTKSPLSIAKGHFSRELQNRDVQGRTQERLCPRDAPSTETHRRTDANHLASRAAVATARLRAVACTLKRQAAQTDATARREALRPWAHPRPSSGRPMPRCIALRPPRHPLRPPAVAPALARSQGSSAAPQRQRRPATCESRRPLPLQPTLAQRSSRAQTVPHRDRGTQAAHRSATTGRQPRFRRQRPGGLLS